MSAYAIMRMVKLKSRRALVGAAQHNTREHMPQNADPARKSLNYSPQTSQEILERYSALLPAKVRKDAVHAVELVFTASPEWFGGSSDKTQTAFYKGVGAWASKLFGEENILSAVVHMDEKTPHVHVIAMPLVKGKLNAKKLIGGSKFRMRELQDDFFKSVGKALGMERGVVREEPKRHTKPRELARLEKELRDGLAALAADRADFEKIKKDFNAELYKGMNANMKGVYERYGLQVEDSGLVMASFEKALKEAAALKKDRTQSKGQAASRSKQKELGI